MKERIERKKEKIKQREEITKERIKEQLNYC